MNHRTNTAIICNDSKFNPFNTHYSIWKLELQSEVDLLMLLFGLSLFPSLCISSHMERAAENSIVTVQRTLRNSLMQCLVLWHIVLLPYRWSHKTIHLHCICMTCTSIYLDISQCTCQGLARHYWLHVSGTAVKPIHV